MDPPRWRPDGNTLGLVRPLQHRVPGRICEIEMVPPRYRTRSSMLISQTLFLPHHAGRIRGRRLGCRLAGLHHWRRSITALFAPECLATFPSASWNKPGRFHASGSGASPQPTLMLSSPGTPSQSARSSEPYPRLGEYDLYTRFLWRSLACPTTRPCRAPGL